MAHCFSLEHAWPVYSLYYTLRTHIFLFLFIEQRCKQKCYDYMIINLFLKHIMILLLLIKFNLHYKRIYLSLFLIEQRCTQKCYDYIIINLFMKHIMISLLLIFFFFFFY